MAQAMNAVFENGVFRPLDTMAASIPEGKVVKLLVETEPSANDPLSLAMQVYDALSPEEVREVEQIALNRDHFFKPKEA